MTCVIEFCRDTKCIYNQDNKCTKLSVILDENRMCLDGFW
jgi:hypothetical protein